MPVVLPPTKGTPLTQGDILDSLPFATANDDGNLSADKRAQYVMVVSRPCKALRDEHVIVAPVHESQIDLGRLTAKKGEAADAAPTETLERMRRVLAGIRDGGQFSDSFYLGPIEAGQNGGRRFAADLSALSTQRVPTTNARQQWVDERRVASLDQEFARDLHMRLLNTFARLGFDDHRWLSDEDLNVLITSGQQELNGATRAFLDAERAIQQQVADGKTPSGKQKEALESLRRKEGDVRDSLAPYLSEREARRVRA